ncbi:MAG: UTP--glucose-1-phosphate uridylyltransferase GalU [Dehalococcoidia bacterium]|nr:MAG: UTP--glucose-1-phosphate uridylyltransferase GalU [Dehalococcoidia bacterium]
MKIRKAVITAAGWGTRFLPATKSQPKEMLPLVDKPIIQYVIEEAVDSGIEHIIMVTALGKHAMENHFDRSFELEDVLKRKGDDKRLEEVQRISDIARICYVRQKEQLGLGHAVSMAKDLVGNEPFALFLPDDLIASEVPAMRQMIGVYDRYESSVIAVEPVPSEKTSAYGIINPKQIEERVFQVMDLIEKPSPEKAPSNLGIVGRYILMPDIFDMFDNVAPGAIGEIQLTDALRVLLKHQVIYAYQFEGIRYDTGEPLGFLKASIEYALKRPDLGPAFKQYLQQLDITD